jgi:hypothetical protein
MLALLIGGAFAVRAVLTEEPGESVPILASGHVAEGTTVTDYNSDPPTSGPHWARTADWGIHDEPIPNELQVHNLEHGGIVIQYNETVPEDQIEQLRQIANQCNVKLILAPRPGMESPIAVTAWGRILTMDSVDREQIQEFIKAHVDRGPEKIRTETQLWEMCNV